ncbi:MAG TPA: N-6 DNA methylase, partial [Chthonomonadales bacterium]|nr:N-6 DNA methylase [Chthonomonadales bacterium]
MPRTGILDKQQERAGLSCAPGVSDLFNWYEAGMPAMERKRRGHYSTPLPLVDQILDACGYTPEADLRRVRVLDPACGSGNFLAMAARRLIASTVGMGCSRREQAQLLERNIWGFDPDPVSCFLAKMQLSSQFAGNWHIHQADSLALNWAPCVDLFLANPPYLAAKNADLSGYRSALQRGQADSYLLFLELAMRVVRPGGWIGLVLPDPLLARLNAARERAQLLRQMTLQHLWHLSDVFAAEVGAVVLVAQNVPPATTHQVAWERGHWTASLPLLVAKAQKAETRRVAQARLLSQPAAELRYLLSGEHGELLDRMRAVLEDTGERRLAPLGDFVTISRGEELGRESQFIRPNTGMLDNTHRRGYAVLRGGIDMRPYTQPQAEWRIDHEAVTKPMQRYLAPKLLVVKSTDRLQATIDTRGHVALQTLYLLHVRDCQEVQEPGDRLYFFLALLNSRLLREYVSVLHTAYKWVQPQIEQRVLASLPVPLIERAARQKIIDQAKQLERACSEGGGVVEWSE